MKNRAVNKALYIALCAAGAVLLLGSVILESPKLREASKGLEWLLSACQWVGIICLLAGSVLLMMQTMSQQKKTRFDTRRVTLCGLLLAVMLILGWVEKQFPTPHGIKLGLSNSVLIFAVYMLDIPTAYVLMVYKVLLSNILFGGGLGIAFLLGFSGGLLSLTSMVLISRIKGMHPVTVSIIGGLTHNIGQILMALLVSNTPGMLTLLPWLMISGTVFGLLTGICADRVMKYMKHIRI